MTSPPAPAHARPEAHGPAAAREPAMVFDPLAPDASWAEQTTWADEALARLNKAHGERWKMWYQPLFPRGYGWNAKPNGERLVVINMAAPEALDAEIRRQEAWSARERDVSTIDSGELARMHRELVVAAGLARPSSTGQINILMEMQAIERELDRRQDQAGAS
jgi:hypothetical protein